MPARRPLRLILVSALIGLWLAAMGPVLRRRPRTTYSRDVYFPRAPTSTRSTAGPARPLDREDEEHDRPPGSATCRSSRSCASPSGGMP